ncbi:hypothetical protein [Flavobacterium sp. 3HN19-14]|uniref:hypothetical protein n=1 Tax=Flavobacterium sp. 3HN19-14 TaxID=3448133 RepID=UPI003EE33402
MENRLTSDGKFTQLILEKGIATFSEAIQYVKNLPYGRNASRTDFSLVISENKGSCSTKHAFLKSLADENKVPDVMLFIGIYQMNGTNTPKTAKILSENNIDFIPEAHCYLKIKNDYLDLTSPTACFDNIKSVILEEITIDPLQVGDFKIGYHQAFLKKWLSDSQSAFSFTGFWNIREQCIEALSS